MKKQDLKAFIKNKGVYITLILGALIIVAVLGINKSISDAELKKNGLVDLNESPDIVSNDNTELKNNNVKDNNLYSQLENDRLLEYDSYTGIVPKQNNISSGITGNYADADSSNTADKSAESSNSSITDNSSIADNSIAADSSAADMSGKAEDIEPVQPAGANSVADIPTDDVSGKDSAAENISDTTDLSKENDTDELTQVSIPITADLSFAPEDGLIWPVNGDVILGYSADHAVYHSTLLQFKTNPAILISSPMGTEVRAAKSGVITDISEVPQTGLTVTLEIGDGYSLVYGQLSDVHCNIGDYIEEGEVFAIIDKVSKYYSVEGEHLYFQVRNGEETMNPMLLLRNE